MFVPKLYSILKSGYSKQQFYKDLLAGIIVGIVALPLAIAFAIASGVSPEKGLITAIVAGFIISAFGGSRVQIGGPTGAFIVIVYSIVQMYGIQGLITATFLAGLMIMALGLTRLGSIIQFIPQPLVIGFTTGIALIIFITQINDLLGLGITCMPADFIDKLHVYAIHIGNFNIYAFIIAVCSFIITFFSYKITSRIPGSLFAIVLSTVAVTIFNLPVETIASKFGDIPSTLPWPALPDLHLSTIIPLLKPAFTIAMLGPIESLLSAVVSDGMIGASHRSNMELVAQGGANMCSALFGGIPATGALARTAINVKNGGRTPIAGIVHSLVLLLIMVFFGAWAKLIPLSCLAGILAVVAYNMSEWHSFIAILKGPKSDVLVLLTTFFLTTFFDLTIAIEVGIVLAALLFMRNMAKISKIESITNQLMDVELTDESQGKIKKIEGVEIYEIQGPLFFGNVYRFRELLRRMHTNPKIVILRMQHVPLIDASGLYYLKNAIKELSDKKIQVLLSEVNPHVLKNLQKSSITTYLDGKYNFTTITSALQYAQKSLDRPYGAI